MNEVIQIIGKLLTILKLRGYINDNDYDLILGRRVQREGKGTVAG